jgi:hypothetical protein
VGAAEPFAALYGQTGVEFSVDDDVMTFMDKLQKVSGRISAGQRTDLFRGLGLTDDVIAAMQSPEWAKRSEMPYQTEKQINDLVKERKALMEVKQEWDSAMRSMMTELMPVVEKTVELIEKSDILAKSIRGIKTAAHEAGELAKKFDVKKASSEVYSRIEFVKKWEKKPFEIASSVALGAKNLYEKIHGKEAMSMAGASLALPAMPILGAMATIQSLYRLDATAKRADQSSKPSANVTINVNGAKDSREVAQEVENRIKRVLGVAAASMQLSET